MRPSSASVSTCARKVTSGVPNKVQLFWEVVVGWVSDQVETGLGQRYRHVVPLAVTIFMLVLAANWVELFPGLWHNTDYLPSPDGRRQPDLRPGGHRLRPDQRGQHQGQGLGRLHQSLFSPRHAGWRRSVPSRSS